MADQMVSTKFHGTLVEGGKSKELVAPKEFTETRIAQRTLSYRFFLHQHPYVHALGNRLLESGVKGLQAADTEMKADGTPVLSAPIFSATRYDPTALVAQPHPVRDLDFSTFGPYALYNWELFFHAPLAVAIHLSKNGRYEEAQRWFHFIFDPTDDSSGSSPARFWKVRPFQTATVTMIERLLVNLATGDDATLRDETIRSIDAWRHDPFRPHLVARFRPTAYMLKTVMAYLDNLVAWGDSLFRQDTREALNEATQLYVLAAGILGPRPQEVPKQGKVRPQTYADLAADLDAFGNALRDLEADVPFDLLPAPSSAPGGSGSGSAGQLAAIASIGQSLYFCVPKNDRFVAYWDIVADRLFKLRNSLNLQGVFRQLALFAPPIDPALLARAAASGVDVAAIVSGGNQPLPLVRFQVLVQKASELAQEVKALGGALLAAMEKEDGEALGNLRARHERVMLGLGETVKYGQWQEAIKAREGLEVSLANAVHRYVYYERLLAVPESDVEVPKLEPLDVAGLRDHKLKTAEPEVTRREIEIDVIKELAGIPGGQLMSKAEATELSLTMASNVAQVAAGILDTIAAPLSLIPQIELRVTPFGIGAGGNFGGQQLSQIAGFLANVGRTVGGALGAGATIAGKLASFERREQEWQYQSSVAAGEITQMFKQLRGAQLREALAEVEWKNHQQQIRHAAEIEAFLTDERTGKKTNQALYAWMKREVRGLYTRCLDLAFEVAKKAERALQQELGDPSLSFLDFGGGGGHEGLLAGERLYLDVKRMELAYLDLNRREYELTRHVSLLEVDPTALMSLRATGTCTVTLPEELYDLDCPGHYFRRIKSVSLTLPGVAGPYTSIACKLTLLKSSIRRVPALRSGAYAREGSEDDRFSDHFGSLDAVVTSGGVNDGGMFETQLRDDRVLPFEGAGAVSEWRLELPGTLRQFDYGTIADVLLHVRYTAREGGDLLRSRAVDNLVDRVTEAAASGCVRLLSVRHDFPDEWARFKAAGPLAAGATAPLTLTLRPEHYPYWSRKPNRVDEVKQVAVFARAGKSTITFSDAAGNTDAANENVSFDKMRLGRFVNIPMPAPVGAFSLRVDDTTMDDLWFALRWGGQ